MFDASLFLGMPVSDEMQVALDALNPQLRATFLQGGENYLSLITLQDQTYLGKELGGLADTSRIRLLKDNIASLIKRLLPECPTPEESLVLVSHSAAADSLTQ